MIIDRGDNMEKLRRGDRLTALTKILISRPNYLFSLSEFSERFGAAKSTLSEDLTSVKDSLERFGLGTLETIPGPSGGVRYLPQWSRESERHFLGALAERLAAPERMIPGGFIYMSDILYMPWLMNQVGEIFYSRFCHLDVDYIMTMETKGIPPALMTAQAFNLPLVIVRNDSKVTEGPAVNINYVTGSSRRIQSMSLPKRAVHPGAKVLIIDDFMKAGGTARGMMDLAQEVGADVVGIGVLVATAEPAQKLVDDYKALLVLEDIDEIKRMAHIRPLTD